MKNPIKVLGIILTIIFLGTYFGYQNFKTRTITHNSQIIKIENGDTFFSLSKKLNINDFFYKIYLNKNKPDFELQTGEYLINSGATIKQVIESLDKPAIVEEISLTILEGWNIYDIDEYLEKKGLINKGEYISYTTNKEKILKLSAFYDFIYPKLNTLEGYLYPDTYKLDKNNFKINKLVIKQLDNFENKVYNKILSNYSPEKIQEIINLASIVEKEEKDPGEKPTVAGILKKRLNSGWKIGADITVCYPYKLTSQQCKLVVSKYINEKNDYNTRTMLGLPKTPIGNPSFETIEATINDKQTKYWFYLHNTQTGKIYYAETNAEHEVNKKFMR